MRILVTEDEPTMADLLRQALVEDGHTVEVVHSGERAIDLAAAESFDVLLLDVMLPGIDGFVTCQRLRSRGIGSPVLMLTARENVHDRVRGLDAGADDYLCKPFSLIELLARVRALGRRGPASYDNRLSIGTLLIDTDAMTVSRRSTPIELTAREFAILELLMRRAGSVVQRLEILRHAWDGDYDHRSNVVDVLIKRIRDKIDKPFGCDSIETVYGAGYRFKRQ